MLNDTIKLQSAKPRLDLRNTTEHKIQFLQQQKFARKTKGKMEWEPKE